MLSGMRLRLRWRSERLRLRIGLGSGRDSGGWGGRGIGIRCMHIGCDGLTGLMGLVHRGYERLWKFFLVLGG